MPNPVSGWSDSRYWSFIRSALRSAWSKYPNKFKALEKAKSKAQGVGRRKYDYTCACCTKKYAAQDVSVDHIIPCGSLRSWSDLEHFASRLFCDVEGLQVLCKWCHDKKTLEDRGINPELNSFKKLPAKAQIKKLKKLELEEGSNQAKRLEIYERWLNEQSVT